MTSVDEVDSIMAELGLTTKPAAAQAVPVVSDSKSNEVKDVVDETDVDALMAEIGVAGGSAPSSAGVGRARGISSGPGSAWAANRGRSGPGPGPGRAGPGPGRGRALATHTPDGREIKHSGPTCVECQTPIVGQCLNALGKQYHPECFVCSHCKSPFPGGSFVEHDGRAYCEPHFNELFCPKCQNCGQAIVDKCVTAGEMKYHPNHFTCTGCGKNLVGQAYKIDGKDVYCSSCKPASQSQQLGPRELCAKCKQPILGDYITLNNQKVHAEHFRCEECGKALRGSDSHEWEGHLYDGECYRKLLRNTCAACNKPILGRSITALGRLWHPEHFVCFTCHEPFSGSNFYERDNKPYCETHFAALFGELCTKCNKPVVSNAITFMDKVYHADHFVCSACDKPLLKGKITEWESKAMCMGCYEKLPSEVRKQAEKKREAEKKLAKLREKEKK